MLLYRVVQQGRHLTALSEHKQIKHRRLRFKKSPTRVCQSSTDRPQIKKGMDQWGIEPQTSRKHHYVQSERATTVLQAQIRFSSFPPRSLLESDDSRARTEDRGPRKLVEAFGVFCNCPSSLMSRTKYIKAENELGVKRRVL